jgi:hypothetical protein
MIARRPHPRAFGRERQGTVGSGGGYGGIDCFSLVP